ncbi:aldo/keto reductase [Sinorhizobium sp. BG8]|uniref:aldo/keto reductase n=1 Tax=Sinorhizobium sp. BG8 TaxID=2613773 RepID=UPI00193E69E3|nr:aldo/keto reductase [Sinorhizobium sp. BG8]QRM54341.1 aldo/keto reductase [Sinorhizobium sp. BG8]
MSNVNASRAGTFRIGGDLEVARLGYGALHLTGPGNWGPPADPAGAIKLLRHLPRIGVNFIDTADSYGPDVSEELIREALHPYDGMVVATKAGLVRDGPDMWRPDGRPEHLIAQAKRSLLKLGVDRIDLWHLHRIDPQVPTGEQFAAVRQLLDEGIIRHAGLSQVSVDQIKAAQQLFPVSTVQNLYNVANRQSEDVLVYCEANAIGFIPWHPLASGGLSGTQSPLDNFARRNSLKPSQVALAWLLKRSPVMLPIPGSGNIAHVEENIASADIDVSNLNAD